MFKENNLYFAKHCGPQWSLLWIHEDASNNPSEYETVAHVFITSATSLWSLNFLDKFLKRFSLAWDFKKWKKTWKSNQRNSCAVKSFVQQSTGESCRLKTWGAQRLSLPLVFTLSNVPSQASGCSQETWLIRPLHPGSITFLQVDISREENIN